MKKITIEIPTGNWFGDGTLEFGREIIIEYTDNDDLLEKLDNLSENDYREGMIEDLTIRQWIEENI